MTEFNKGVYIFKNQGNNNGRFIEIKTTTDKTMIYSIYNYFDNKIEKDERACIIDNKKTKKKDSIKLYTHIYSPNMAERTF